MGLPFKVLARFLLALLSGPFGNVLASVVGTTATITWTTPTNTNSVIEWGLTTAYGNAVENASGVNGTNTKTHEVVIDSVDGLLSNTTYHYRIWDGTQFSEDYVFTTPV